MFHDQHIYILLRRYLILEVQHSTVWTFLVLFINKILYFLINKFQTIQLKFTIKIISNLIQNNIFMFSTFQSNILIRRSSLLCLHRTYNRTSSLFIKHRHFCIIPQNQTHIMLLLLHSTKPPNNILFILSTSRQ